jgi:AcrR family transcriptional regulator
MARTLNAQDHAARRREILEAAQRLVYTKGFDQMTIQDILDELQMSKGALYHYFGSKSAVLEALVERIVDEIEPSLIAIVQDESISGLDKLQRFFDTAVRWKTARKALMLSLIQVWYADENAIVRQKVFATMVRRVTPWFTKIIDQGIREASFTTHHPEHACQVSIYLLQGMGDEFARLLFADHADPTLLTRAEQVTAAYTEALERVLGAATGSISLMDDEALLEWFSYPERKEYEGENVLEGIGQSVVRQ